jgi:hypothetical protein
MINIIKIFNIILLDIIVIKYLKKKNINNMIILLIMEILYKIKKINIMDICFKINIVLSKINKNLKIHQ